MGSFICRQPNGLLCRFSTIVDTVTDYNMTEEEYIRMKMEQTREDAEDVIKNHLKPFEWIDEYFAPHNMTEEEFEQIKMEMCVDSRKIRIEVGCTRCPYAGHIELRECPDAYTEKAPYCKLYNHEAI